MRHDFGGKVVLITGSSGGIGAQIAREFSKYGAIVVITGRNGANVAQVAQECKQLSPTNIKPLEVIADLTKDIDVERLLTATINRHGKLDILINNAGYCQLTSILDPKSIVLFDQVHNLDVRSVVHLTIRAVPYLIKSKGNIVNISSICALKPLPIFYAYNMAKASLDMFTKSIALELGPHGIRVNAINSGGVKSGFFHAIGMTDEQVDKQMEILKGSSPLNIVGETIDIANLTLFLASDEAKYMTGSCVLADGGTLHSSITVAE